MVADTSEIEGRRSALRWEMLGAGVVTLALLTLLVNFAAGRALAPLQRMTTTARRITEGDRGRRIRPDRPNTELGQAAEAFDGMLNALEAAEVKTRRFLADAAHELRTHWRASRRWRSS